MGAGLLAKAVCQPTLLATDTTLSRASPLPQETAVPHQFFLPRIEDEKNHETTRPRPEHPDRPTATRPAQCHHRRPRRTGRPQRRTRSHGQWPRHPHWRHRHRTARRFHQSATLLCRRACAQRQRRCHGAGVDTRGRLADQPHRLHQHPQPGRGARRADRARPRAAAG
ncbi:hypothetical protein D3C75_665200 [compost metagenome]